MALTAANITFQVISTNFEDYIEARKAKRKTSEPYNYHEYHNLTEITLQLEEMQKSDPRVIQMEVIGKSVQFRDLRIVKLSFGERNEKRPIVFIECGIHAREWVSPAACMSLIDHLYKKRPLMTEHYDFHVMPNLNPDGYEYSWTSDRFWRTNRANTTGGLCSGVDLNRNFNTTLFCDLERGRNSRDPCSNLFCGSKPFSEPETTALAAYVMRLKPAAYFSVHSYSQYWMYPFYYTFNKTFDDEELKRLAVKAVMGIKAKTGAQFTAGTSAQVSCKYQTS